MGNSRFDSSAYASYTASTAHMPRAERFSQRQMHPDLDPAKIVRRECVDSPANPETTPIILAVDETGSMGYLAEEIIKKGLGVIMNSIYDEKPVTDPQICCMGVGDATCDRAPLQVTQFEAAVQPMVTQIENIWLEGKGGGNGGETYLLPWWFAANKIVADSFRKRGRRGYLFTIGDEDFVPVVTASQIHHFLGGATQLDVQAKDLLAEVEREWHVFHLIVKPVSHQPVVAHWRELLGHRAIEVPDHSRLAHGIVEIIKMVEANGGVSTGWTSKETSLVVRNATAAVEAV